MRNRLGAGAALLVTSAFVFGCGASAPTGATEEVGANHQGLAGIGGIGVLTFPCLPQRFDVMRGEGTCDLPPASSAGTWSVQPLYPDGPASVQSHFCAYFWTSYGSAPACAPPPDTIPRIYAEKITPRGYCPLSTCAPIDDVSVPVPTPSGGSGGSTGGGGGGGGGGGACLTAACRRQQVVTKVQRANAVVPQETPGPSPDPGSGSGSVSDPGPSFNSNIGCCDACAEIGGHRAYVVIPQNTLVDYVTFDAPLANGGVQSVRIDNPSSSLVRVELDPNAPDGTTPYQQVTLHNVHYFPAE